MWHAMRDLQPLEFARFTGHVAREITACIDELAVSTRSGRETLELVLPMPFAMAMAVAHVPDAAALPMPPEPIATFLADAAAACRRVARDDDASAALSIALGTQAATAVLEGVDDRAYVTWAIYRSYVEVLLQTDPLPPEIERAALAIFQSGVRIAVGRVVAHLAPELYRQIHQSSVMLRAAFAEAGPDLAKAPDVPPLAAWFLKGLSNEGIPTGLQAAAFCAGYWACRRVFKTENQSCDLSGVTRDDMLTWLGKDELDFGGVLPEDAFDAIGPLAAPWKLADIRRPLTGGALIAVAEQSCAAARR
jgi:hypothetical protein